MANDLTGDFDVVAQFAIPAANRVLAAMHRSERFPHSASIRVDDTDSTVSGGFRPSALAAVDAFGDAVADHQRIRNLSPLTGLLASTNEIAAALDPVVNTDNAGVFADPVVPSNLQGRAQLQLFPPTIDVSDGSGTNVTVRIRMLARYFPDPNTSPMAEFVRGELRITAPVSQVASQVANVVEIDIKAANVTASFVRDWSSRPLSAEDLTAINLLIRNTLKTSFLPSNTTLPAEIRHMQFRTMQGAGNAIAVLLNLESDRGNSNSATNIFLDTGDDFAFGVGSDFVLAAFQPTIDAILSQPVDPVSKWGVTYSFTLNSAEFALRNDEIVLTIRGRAHTPSWPPNFGFTVTQRFSLEVSGGTADLVVGDISLDTSNWILDRFRGMAMTAIRTVRNRALRDSSAGRTVRRMLSADGNLGGFLNSLAKPPHPTPTPQLQQFHLAYSAVRIRPSGIILHGSLAASDWPVAHAEFERISSSGNGLAGGMTGVNQEPGYSALKSWIPGGTIESFEWKSQGQSLPGFSDQDRFVYSKPAPGASSELPGATPVSGYVPLCLTIHGSRLSAGGPVVPQAVTATVCAVNSFPLLDVAFDGDIPMIALAQPGPRGTVDVTGHTSAQKAVRAGVTPNLIVHFGDRNSAGSLDILVQALRESERGDASTAIVAALSPADLASARYTEGVTYAEDQDGSWERRFGLSITRRPMTVIVAPGGKVVWQHDGPVDSGMLAAALRTSLVAGRRVVAAMQPPAVRIGHLPPNFLVEYASARQVTLRKVIGRPVILVFWRSSSKPSIEMVRDLGQTSATGEGPLVLAINDGEPDDLARKVAAESKLSAIVVTDASRSISLAYGVETWPTVVSIDALGLVRSVRHGRTNGDSAESRSEQKSAGSPGA